MLGMHSTGTIRRRLRLELLLLRAVTALNTCILGVIFLVGWKSPDGEVRATNFVLVDEKDNLRGSWSVREGSTLFTIWNKEQVPVVRIGDVFDVASVSLRSKDKDIVELSGSEDGASIRLYNRKEETRIRLSSSSGTGDRIQIYGEGEKILWSAPED